MTFEELNLIEPILKALRTEGYERPTPIQEQAIPIVLEGKDLQGCAQTGTGKTAAFAIPILQLLAQNPAPAQGRKAIRSLILTPTRELAIQIGESFTAYGWHTGLRHTVIFGGVPQHSQVDALRRGVDILIATPGRLMDLIGQRFISLKDIEIFVLDEADRMLDMGFIADIRRIVPQLPTKRQTLFFSATMPADIQRLASSLLTNPVAVAVTPIASTAETIQQTLYYVEKPNKNLLLAHILKDKTIETALVFTKTKHGADKVVKYLNQVRISAEAIHGNKSQNARQRALQNFKSRHPYGRGAQYTIEYDGQKYEYSLGTQGWASRILAVMDVDGDGKPDFHISTGDGVEYLLLSSQAKPGRNAPSASLASVGGC